jgi:hypothetical protein
MLNVFVKASGKVLASKFFTCTYRTYKCGHIYVQYSSLQNRPHPLHTLGFDRIPVVLGYPCPSLTNYHPAGSQDPRIASLYFQASGLHVAYSQ